MFQRFKGTKYFAYDVYTGVFHYKYAQVTLCRDSYWEINLHFLSPLSLLLLKFKNTFYFLMLKKYKLHFNYEIKLFKKIICSN